MSARPRDEEFARFAARHTLHPQGQEPRPQRLEPLKEQGVTDEKSLVDHTLKVMQASDTKCFRGAYGREVYANDQMNTIVITSDNKPDKSTVYFNDKITQGISATDRLESMRKEESKDYKIDCQIREGGSQALEQDRIARPFEAPSPEQNNINGPTNEHTDSTPARKSLSNYRRGDDESRQQTNEKRPGERLIDRYRRSAGDDGSDR